MKHKILLASCVGLVIQKLSFIFTKCPHELKTICISTAANVYEEKPWLEEEKQPFRDMGFNLIEYDISDKSKAAVDERLKDADVIYVTGGNTYYLLEKMKKCGFEDIIRTSLNNGALYIGSSAGAVVACPIIDFIRDMDDPSQAILSDYKGLGLVDFKVLPHIDHPHYGSKARKIAAEIVSKERLIGLRDKQAIFVNGSYIEIFDA